MRKGVKGGCVWLHLLKGGKRLKILSDPNFCYKIKKIEILMNCIDGITITTKYS